MNRLALAIPVLFAVAILALQPRGRFVPPAAATPGYPLPEGYTRLVFDDSDIVAWMVRAENAQRGRLAGRVDAEGKPVHVIPALDHTAYDRRCEQRVPFSDRYFLEYPPAALAFFRLVYLASGSRGRADVGATLLDEHEFNMACHTPATEGENELYRGIRRGIDASVMVLLLGLIGVMLLVRRGIGGKEIAPGSPWLCALPAMLYFSSCRYDIIPAGLVLLGLALTARGRPNLGALALGLAIAFKLYPLILAPLILRYAFPGWRGAAVWAACCALPALVANAVLLLTDGWPAVLVPLQFQFGRDIDFMLVVYGPLLPKMLGEGLLGSLFRNGSVFVLVLAMCYRKPPDIESLLRRCALAVMLFAILQVFYSPQWWLWFAVLLIPLARTHRGLTALIVLTDLLTYTTFPLAYDLIIIGEFDDAEVTLFWKAIRCSEITLVSNTLTYLRVLLWGAIAAVLFVGERRMGKKERAPESGALS